MPRLKRFRGVLVGSALVVILIGAEVGLRVFKGPEACVQVENGGTEPIENLSITSGGAHATVARIEPGASARIFLGGSGTHTLRMTFRQKGNAVAAFSHPGFDAEQLSREGFKLMLRIRPNEVERFQDDADPSTPVGWFLRNAWSSLLESLGLDPDVSH